MLLAIHGGAGNRKPSKKHLDTIREALQAGYDQMRNGWGALSAVVEAITVLEDSSIFNAGAGGVLQMDGIRRLDASLMEGAELKAGSVIGLEGIRNPIRAARLVLDLPHVMRRKERVRRGNAPRDFIRRGRHSPGEHPLRNVADQPVLGLLGKRAVGRPVGQRG